jgi:hypothetical protein
LKALGSSLSPRWAPLYSTAVPVDFAIWIVVVVLNCDSDLVTVYVPSLAMLDPLPVVSIFSSFVVD